MGAKAEGFQYKNVNKQIYIFANGFTLKWGTTGMCNEYYQGSKLLLSAISRQVIFPLGYKYSKD